MCRLYFWRIFNKSFKNAILHKMRMFTETYIILRIPSSEPEQ